MTTQLIKKFTYNERLFRDNFLLISHALTREPTSNGSIKNSAHKGYNFSM
jgi:hypothetical protein